MQNVPIQLYEDEIVLDSEIIQFIVFFQQWIQLYRPGSLLNGATFLSVKYMILL